MKLNLTELLMLLFVIGISITATNQCTQKRRATKSIDNLEALVIEQKKELIRSSNEIAKTISSNDTLKSKIKELETSRNNILSVYNKQKTELGNITSDSLYMLLKGRRELVGKLYDVDSVILIKGNMDRLALRECVEINLSLVSENDLLQKASDSYMNSAIELSSRWTTCEDSKAQLERDLREKDLEVKKYKGKVWGNRAMTGVVTIALVAIILL